MKKLSNVLAIAGYIVGAWSTLTVVLELQRANWAISIVRQQHHGHWVGLGYLVGILLFTVAVRVRHRKET